MDPPPMMRQLDVKGYWTGESPDLVGVQQKAQVLSNIYRESPALTYREAAVAEEFHTLAEQWREETRFESSLAAITEHPAYRAIVALGDEVVPLLLRQLRRRGDPEFWFTALREITGADPVRADQWGNVRAMSEDWLRWGRDNHLLQ
jgi:hypothetical protein